MNGDKKELRRWVRLCKQRYSAGQLAGWSAVLLGRLEAHPAFRSARVVLLYYALPDEVQTQAFVEKWSREKTVLLPVVKGEELELRRYTGTAGLRKGSFDIDEPCGEAFTAYGRIDLALVPGMAFDGQGNRLGRGKGYYDRLLPQLEAYKIGLCFQFQVCEAIPTEAFDCPMDEVWTEEGCVIGTRCPQ